MTSFVEYCSNFVLTWLYILIKKGVAKFVGVVLNKLAKIVVNHQRWMKVDQIAVKRFFVRKKTDRASPNIGKILTYNRG